MAEATQTRYERVREVLNRAAGGSTADYGGVGRPWNLPLAELERVEVYGVRMIAPAAAAKAPAARGCGCGCATSGQSPEGDAPEERHPRYPGRGAASGLVKGLRGEPPYDGSVFPRFPWGGAPVPPEEVQLVSDWIDDGCPADDHETALRVEAEQTEALRAEVTAESVEPAVARVFEVYGGPANEYRGQRGELRQRANLDCMPEPELEKLRWAFRELYALNKWPLDRRSYNNMALIHQDHCQHGWERFLPWHRIYLYEFEQALQDMVPDVTMPYWDWTMPQYMPHCPEKGEIIPPSFKAYLTGDSIGWLEKEARPPLPAKAARTLRKSMAGVRFARLSDFFARVEQEIGAEYVQEEYRNSFIEALLQGNPLWYPLRYPGQYNKGGKPGTINSVIHYHYPTAQDMDEILALGSFRDFGGGSLYNDSFGFLDQNPHNTMHIWTGGMNPDPDVDSHAELLAGDVGRTRNRGVRATGRRFHTREDMFRPQPFGDMFSNLTAAYDPIFWPIHVNIDRVWWEWQQAHPASRPVDLDAVLTPWSYTIADTLDIARFGYEYVKSAYVVPVGPETPVGRFVSRPIGLPQAVRNGFRSAEVRLHRVPQLDRSCFVRVFLNVPDANAATPIDHPGYAGYLAVFGHGDCIGGPGHCSVPERRPHDLRPRSHNTPRNHRVNVTRTARRLVEAGASSLQVTLVVVGVDYCEDAELLRLEGVSLNFLD